MFVSSPFTVSIMLTGLIAIVPNTNNNAQFATAYLVSDDAHIPTLEIFGDVTLEHEGDNPKCARSKGPEQGWVVICDLSNTSVSLGGADDEENPRALPTKPGTALPVSADDQKSKNWIVRMSNIESGIGRVKSQADLESLVTSSIQFGWDTIETVELDGGEAGKPAKIGFKSAGGPASALTQAVAESILFRVGIKQIPIRISVVSEGSDNRSVITAKCSRVDCFTLYVDNSMPPSDVCDSSSEGAHFDRYYDLVQNFGNRMLPFSVDERDCRVGDAKLVDLQLLDNSLTLFSPIMPMASTKLRANFPDLMGKQNLFLDRLVKRINPKSLPLISHATQVQNRVICPPVVLEP